MQAQIRGDQYLYGARKTYPGYYPVRPVEIRAIQSDNMSKLLISYPKANTGGPGQYIIEVMIVPLSPLLTIQASADLPALLEAPLAEEELPGNHITIALCRMQLLASLPNEQEEDEKKDDD